MPQVHTPFHLSILFHPTIISASSGMSRMSIICFDVIPFNPESCSRIKSRYSLLDATFITSQSFDGCPAIVPYHTIENQKREKTCRYQKMDSAGDAKGYANHALFTRFAAATLRYAISSIPMFSTAKMIRYTGMIQMPTACWIFPNTIGMKVLPI